ncbi:TetR/AcrR family transcriptional regulator [Streptomyces sp. NBC_01262]|uniref:TetR/AcrR family transcriptional regulator n=1 Tax=Streptomyces sp. NBC_01262 TaxID=2903803 RepID=UPI002E2F7FD0|nr:TetR/AcrR family transcriptional regulator [Streptomyces sp. NBC_01262]
MTSEMSLRERKKHATRAALSHAAWSLMIEKGLDAATPETIAEAVDVSSRTFRNYFSSREEAILDGLVRRAASLVDAIRARPADEPVWDSLTRILPDVLAGVIGDRDDAAVLMRAVRDNPAMQAQHLVTYQRTGQLLAEVIAERTGTDVERDLAPRLLAAAASLALRTSVELWVEGATGAALPDLVRESLAQLRAGLPLGTAPAA